MCFPKIQGEEVGAKWGGDPEQRRGGVKGTKELDEHKR